LQKVGGTEVIRALVVPNLRDYESLLREAMDSMDDNKRKEGEILIDALTEALLTIEGENVGAVNGFANGHAAEMKAQLSEKIGSLLAEKLLNSGGPKVLKAVLDC